MDKKMIELEITDYGYSGEGVGRNGGKVCFVPYTIKGEKVLAKIKQERSGFCKCQPVKILKVSERRQVPPCPYFACCGGCAFQHLSYDDELEIKRNMLASQLKKVGFGGEIHLARSPKEYFYRNKIKLFCSGDRLALYRAESNDKIEIERCLLVEKEIDQAMCVVQTFIFAKKIGEAIQNVYIRKQGDGLLVWFIFKHNIKVDFQGLQIMLGAKSGIYSSVAAQKPKHISGLEVLSANEFDLECEFAVDAFHQVNNEVGEKLYKKVVSLAKGNNVINAYSGAGVLSALLAKKKKLVYGIELGVAEHLSAQSLKEKNNIENLFNIQGDCAKHIPKLLNSSIDCIILDPPRSGADKTVIEAINNSDVAQVIYISCDSASLARDISRLGRYIVQQVYLFDMFARTSSSETLCVLTKR